MPKLAPWVLAAATGLLAACQPGGEVISPALPPDGPQYAPDDPCRGVVPELCPR